MPGGVAILTSLFPPSVGGIQSQTLALARALAEAGADVCVVTRPAAGLPLREERDGVTVLRTGLVGASGPAATLAYVAGAVRTIAALGERIRVVHAHQMLSPATVALAIHALRGTPFVVTVHASGSIGEVAQLHRQGPLGRARLAALRRWAAAFVAVSAPIREELLAAGLPPARVLRMANGVDTRRFAPATAGERRRRRTALGFPAGPMVVYSGRLAPEKGPDVLLDAWRLVVPGAAAATLCIVGEGPERGSLEARVRRLGLSRSVRFAGAVQDVAGWIRAADAFVLPSRTEGLSVALLEAMACGVSIVATDVGGTREAAPPGTALLVPPEDPGALGAALRLAIAGGRAVVTMRRAARSRAVEIYGIAGVARRHLDLYRKVAEAAAEGGAHGGRRERDRLRRLVVPGAD